MSRVATFALYQLAAKHDGNPLTDDASLRLRPAEGIAKTHFQVVMCSFFFEGVGGG